MNENTKDRNNKDDNSLPRGDSPSQGSSEKDTLPKKDNSSKKDSLLSQKTQSPRKNVSPRKNSSPRKSGSPRQDLIDHIKQQKTLLNKKDNDVGLEPLADPFIKTEKMVGVKRLGTAYGYLPSPEHFSPWDRNHPERPERPMAINQLVSRLYDFLVHIKPSDIIKDEKAVRAAINCTYQLSDIAQGPLCDDLVYISFLSDLFDRGEIGATMFDSIFFNGQASLVATLEAVRMAITLARKVANGEVSNGFANIRPPGHHAMNQNPNGYCFLNNVAIVATDLLCNNLAKKILIVDFDVHHGQGTQDTFYEDDRVLYFSIHRYEYGRFWPNLKESNFDHIGKGKGTGFNINVPLNETDIKDYDYISIILNVLLPVAYEFDPCIILVSAGYDCIVGCPEGLMDVTPGMYSHLIQMLSGIAGGKIAVFLEGGYFLPSLAEGGLKTVQALLNYVPPKLNYSHNITPSVVDSINNVKTALRPHWKCFRMDPVVDIDNIFACDRYNCHLAIAKFNGEEDLLTPPFMTRNCYPTVSRFQRALLEKKVQGLQERYASTDTLNRVGFIKNPLSKNHVPPEGFSNTQEVPKRMTTMLDALRKHELIEKMITITTHPSPNNDRSLATEISHQVKQSLLKVHSKEYLRKLETGEGLEQRPDFYCTPSDSYKAALQSCASVCELISKIQKNSFRHGVAILRPPGHHAKRSKGGGFCLVNQIVVGARFAIDKCQMDRVLIVDFDVHHGNGTQELTYDSHNIMYISIHKFDKQNFFPNEEASNFNHVGRGAAAGFNMNIAFNNAKMGNADYLFTWIKAVLPAAYAFNPDLIMISAGFDACVHDPLGGYNVNPELFGHLVSTIKQIAPVVISLEGGYHHEGSALCMVNCVRALLGEPIPMPQLGEIHPEAAEATYRTLTVMRPFWSIFDTCKKLNRRVHTQEEFDDMIKNAEKVFSEKNLRF